jgi:hypothetical protein
MDIYEKLTDSDELRMILGEHPPLNATVRHTPSNREYIMGFQSFGTKGLSREWLYDNYNMNNVEEEDSEW